MLVKLDEARLSPLAKFLVLAPCNVFDARCKNEEFRERAPMTLKAKAVSAARRRTAYPRDER